jgi:hypothetical protein
MNKKPKKPVIASQKTTKNKTRKQARTSSNRKKGRKTRDWLQNKTKQNKKQALTELQNLIKIETMEETSKKVCKDCRRAYRERAEKIIYRSGNKGGEKSSDVCVRVCSLRSSFLFSSPTGAMARAMGGALLRQNESLFCCCFGREGGWAAKTTVVPVKFTGRMKKACPSPSPSGGLWSIGTSL